MLIATRAIAYALPAVASVLLAQQTADPLSGGAGWIGTGLLGSVLAWLCWVYLPAKDKQLAALLETHAAERKGDREREDQEREKDRLSRHDGLNRMQQVVASIQSQHLGDAERDREAFGKRQDKVEAAIHEQTLTLQRELREAACKMGYGPHQPPKKEPQ